MIRAPGTELDAITQAPRSHIGQTVRVAGAIEEILSPRAFVLEGDDWSSEQVMPVLTREPVLFAGLRPELQDEVIVRGTVRRLGKADLERVLGWTLEPGLAERVVGRPVVIANRISQVGEYASWSERDPERTGAGMLLILTYGDPAMLIGQPVHLRRVQVYRVTEDRLWVGPRRSKQVLVIPSKPAQLERIRPGMMIELSGTAKSLGDQELYIEASRIAAVQEGTTATVRTQDG